MPYRKPPSKSEMNAFKKAQKDNQKDQKKVKKIRDAFRKKHDYYATGAKAKVEAPKKKTAPKKKAPKKTAPKKKDEQKDLLQSVMGIMAEVGKEKKKSTSKEIDSKVALDKKAEKGKLTLRDFKDFVIDDDKSFDVITGMEDDMRESQGYDIVYWISRVSKRADFVDELTEKQSDRLSEIMAKDIQIQTNKKLKAFYDKFIKGKKLKNMTAVKKLFEKEYDETTYKH